MQRDILYIGRKGRREELEGRREKEGSREREGGRGR